MSWNFDSLSSKCEQSTQEYKMHVLYISQRKFCCWKSSTWFPKHFLSLCKPRSSVLSYQPLMRDTDILTQVIRLWALAHLLCCSYSVTVWTIACQAPLSMGFFGQVYWSGLPFAGSQGSNLHLLCHLQLQADPLPLCHWEPPPPYVHKYTWKMGCEGKERETGISEPTKGKKGKGTNKTLKKADGNGLHGGWGEEFSQRTCYFGGRLWPAQRKKCHRTSFFLPRGLWS